MNVVPDETAVRAPPPGRNSTGVPGMVHVITMVAPAPYDGLLGLAEPAFTVGELQTVINLGNVNKND